MSSGPPSPLVDLRALAPPGVALAHMAAFGLGAMLFAGYSVISALVQIPRSSGYGLGLTTALAGLVLLPTSIGSQAANRLTHRVVRRIRPARLLPLVPLVIGVVTGCLALWHDELWQVLVGGFIQGLGVGAGFVLMATMIVTAAAPGQVGGTAALNQVLRTMGGAVGSAAVGALVAAGTRPGRQIADESAYTSALVGTSLGCALLALRLALAPVLGRRLTRHPQKESADA